MSIDSNQLLTNLELEGEIDPSLLGADGQVDPDKLARQYREVIASSTALFQREFDGWYKKLLEVPKEDIEPYIDFSYEGWTLQNQVPSLFEDRPDPEKHEAEINELNRKIECINEVFRKYHKDSAIKLTAVKQSLGLR